MPWPDEIGCPKQYSSDDEDGQARGSNYAPKAAGGTGLFYALVGLGK